MFSLKKCVTVIDIHIKNLRGRVSLYFLLVILVPDIGTPQTISAPYVLVNANKNTQYIILLSFPQIFFKSKVLHLLHFYISQIIQGCEEYLKPIVLINIKHLPVIGT